MLETILFALAHFALCILFFQVIQRPLFILYNRGMNKTAVNRNEWFGMLCKGLRTDLIAAAYLTGLPVLLLLVLSLIPGTDVRCYVLALEGVLAVLVSLAVVSDTALYRFWQFKLEASVLSYLRHPKAAFASVSLLYIIVGVVALALMACVYFAFVWVASLALEGLIIPDLSSLLWHLGFVLLALVLAACLFAFIRGLDHHPVNPSVAYFSPNQFVNHSTLNPLFNFIFSLSVQDTYSRDFRYFNSDECRREFEQMMPKDGTTRTELLNTRRPNILLIVWESLSSRYISTLGGEGGVMPNVERLAEEGVLFTRCDCGSFRTERGLICVLNGVPGQPTDNLIMHSSKLMRLPALPRELQRAGYETMSLHGGNCQIMHKSDLYFTTGHSRLVQQKDLPAGHPSNRWGIHDGFTFDWLYDDIQQKTKDGKQWFTTYQTLSSHQPFDVPYHKLDDMKKNAFAYVDDCFGRFIDKLKASPAWDNLLVVVTGDHGFNFDEAIDRDKYPHICLMMLGGAVRKPLKFDKIMMQTDIAATLLAQLGLNHDAFKFSRDVFSDAYRYPFSFHSYINGMAFRDETGFTDFDTLADRAVIGADPEREHKAKVFLQTLYEFLSKK